GCGGGRGLRCHAVLRAHHGGRVWRKRPAPRGRRAHARRRAVARVLERPLAARAAVADRRRRALLGPSARRVRRYDHVRRQLSRTHADRAAGRLRSAREPAGSRHRAQPGPGRGLAGRADRAARPLAEGAVSLRAELRVEYPDFVLDAALNAAPGEVVAVLGPNGAGKSLLLRALAGLVPLARGRGRPDGRVLEGRAAGIYVPAEQRSIGVVFQDYLLFPHLSALDNVAFGLRQRGHSRAAARARARDWLARVGLADHAAAR